MRFKIGDKAVYPSHGLTVIKGVESKEVAGSRLDFYVLQIVASGATLMVPTTTCDRAGMRGLITDGEVAEVYTILRTPGRVSQRTWNRRCREFNDKLRSGSMIEVAEVLRDLWALQSSKGLSDGEKKMLEKSKGLIVAEISAARTSSQQIVEEEINQLLMPH
jgi:CarD family transcriptional regulator